MSPGVRDCEAFGPQNMFSRNGETWGSVGARGGQWSVPGHGRNGPAAEAVGPARVLSTSG